MKRLLKGLAGLFFVVVPLIVLAGGLGLLWLSRSLPPVSGTMSVDGLGGPVTIARDRNGVPHVTGGTKEDVFAALGFAHAQDRLWQMEMTRMAGQGRLSEIFGEATIDTDVWLRTVGLHEAAAASYEGFPEEAKRLLEAYARGVNAWMTREPRLFSSSLPPEFVILGHEPEPWRPEDSVTIIKMMSVSLASNSSEEVQRLAFARAGLSSAEIAELLPPLPDADVPVLPDIEELLEIEDAEAISQAAALPEGPFDALTRVGLMGKGASNNWVVSGERTDTGKPILANDPHLALTAPSIWYLAHLRIEPEKGEAANMVGATLAGAPLVLLGRNDHLAWGFTNTGADTQDLFIERTDPEDGARYLAPDGWRSFETEEVAIEVKGGEDHVFTRRATRHGPVMPESYRGLGALLPDDMVAALAWTALSHDDTTMLAGLDVWDFQTVDDFQQGMEEFVTPMQSMVIADTAGNIGLLAPARIPVRHEDNLVLGRAPVPGWDVTYDWQGWIDYADLPRRTNPPAGAIGTANTRIVDTDYEHLLTMDWDETYRQRRVDELVIDAEGEHTMEASRAAQTDVHSLAFAALIPAMLGHVEGREDVDPFVAAVLGDWNFEMSREGPEPLIAMAWLREATRAIFGDDLGDAFEPWFRARAQVMEDVLAGRTARDWCDDIGTEARESCGDVLAAALQSALARLEQRFGDDRTEWSWGAAHIALSEHRPFGEVSPLDRVFNIKVESPGGPYTLNRGRTDFDAGEAPFANRHASSYRAIYDLADLDGSTYMIPTGQSGNVFSGHYSDLAEPWSDVKAIAIPADPVRFGDEIDSVWQIVP